MTINIHPIPALSDNYIWAIIDLEQKTALVVDPGSAKPVIEFLQAHSLQLKAILITHHHYDHTDGALELKHLYDALVFAPAVENVVGATSNVQDGDLIQIPDFPVSFEVIGIPGHTLGHVAYYSKGMLFCGDTLFAAGCGRIFEGTPEQMYASLQKLASLPDATDVYCGHEYTQNNLRFAQMVEPGNEDIEAKLEEVTDLRNHQLVTLPSTILSEKLTNPFLRCYSQEIISNLENATHTELTDPVDVFATLREWKNQFSS